MRSQPTQVTGGEGARGNSRSTRHGAGGKLARQRDPPVRDVLVDFLLPGDPALHPPEPPILDSPLTRPPRRQLRGIGPTASSVSSITVCRPGSRSTKNAPSPLLALSSEASDAQAQSVLLSARGSPACPVRSGCLTQLGGETDGGLLSSSLPDQTLFGSCTKPDFRAVLIGLEHSCGHHYGIQTAGTAAGDNADRLVLARANWHGLDYAARPREHTGDALHRIVERQGNKQIDLMDVFSHQLGHHPDQATTTPAHRAKSSKLLSQDLVFALIHGPHPHRSFAPTRRHISRPADHVDVRRPMRHAPPPSPGSSGRLDLSTP